MGSKYDQVTLEARCEIAELYRAGRSIRKIAAAMDREPSTISRELKRNTGSGPQAGAYQPVTPSSRPKRGGGQAQGWIAVLPPCRPQTAGEKGAGAVRRRG